MVTEEEPQIDVKSPHPPLVFKKLLCVYVSILIIYYTFNFLIQLPWIAFHFEPISPAAHLNADGSKRVHQSLDIGWSIKLTIFSVIEFIFPKAWAMILFLDKDTGQKYPLTFKFIFW